VIEARHLRKSFRGQTAIEDVSLQVERGEVVGFLGPNGAGKTTTLRILAGVFPPTAGEAVIDGHDVTRAPLAARRRLGYAPERPALHLEMTVARILDFAATLRDVGGRDARRAAVGRAIERSGLAGTGGRRIGTLSKGYRQRVGLALALVGDPPALLLDEPTAGLDPEQSADTRRLVRELAAEHAILVSSHALAEVETISDRVVILHRGRVLAADRPGVLAARLRPVSVIQVEAAAPGDALAEVLGAIDGVRRVVVLDAPDGRVRVMVEAEPGRDVRAALATAVVERHWPLFALTPVETSLEEAFLALVAASERR
jgi:ABC-2 type transport system ATP-binding protein